MMDTIGKYIAFVAQDNFVVLDDYSDRCSRRLSSDRREKLASHLGETVPLDRSKETVVIGEKLAVLVETDAAGKPTARIVDFISRREQAKEAEKLWGENNPSVHPSSNYSTHSKWDWEPGYGPNY